MLFVPFLSFFIFKRFGFLDGPGGGVFCYPLLWHVSFSFYENGVFLFSLCILGGPLELLDVFLRALLGGCQDFRNASGGISCLLVIWGCRFVGLMYSTLCWICSFFLFPPDTVVIPFPSTSMSPGALCFIVDRIRSVF